jgi:hypothetical protein
VKYAETNLYNIEFLQKADDAKLFSLPEGHEVSSRPGVAKAVLSVQETLGNRDPKDRLRANCRCKVHTVRMLAGKTYQIDMVTLSPDLDPYLRLENARGEELAEDDDGGGFPNARIIFNCEETGNYRVICTSYTPATGRYTLTVKGFRED